MGDLGEMLVNAGLARAVGTARHGEYVATLTECEHAAKLYGAGRWSDPEVLTQFTDPNPLLEKLSQPYVPSEWREWGDRYREIVESSGLLLRMGVPDAREVMMNRIRDETDQVYVRTAFARELAMRNDLEGVDYLVNRIASITTRPHWSEDRVSSDVRAHEVSILHELQRLMRREGEDAFLQYEDQRKALIAWYLEHRPRLRWLERAHCLGVPSEP
jgi:hypothetical protein